MEPNYTNFRNPATDALYPPKASIDESEKDEPVKAANCGRPSDANIQPSLDWTSQAHSLIAEIHQIKDKFYSTNTQDIVEDIKRFGAMYKDQFIEMLYLESQSEISNNESLKISLRKASFSLLEKIMLPSVRGWLSADTASKKKFQNIPIIHHSFTSQLLDELFANPNFSSRHKYQVARDLIEGILSVSKLSPTKRSKLEKSPLLNIFPFPKQIIELYNNGYDSLADKIIEDINNQPYLSIFAIRWVIKIFRKTSESSLLCDWETKKNAFAKLEGCLEIPQPDQFFTLTEKDITLPEKLTINKGSKNLALHVQNTVWNVALVNLDSAFRLIDYFNKWNNEGKSALAKWCRSCPTDIIAASPPFLIWLDKRIKNGEKEALVFKDLSKSSLAVLKKPEFWRRCRLIDFSETKFWQNILWLFNTDADLFLKNICDVAKQSGVKEEVVSTIEPWSQKEWAPNTAKQFQSDSLFRQWLQNVLLLFGTENSEDLETGLNLLPIAYKELVWRLSNFSKQDIEKCLKFAVRHPSHDALEMLFKLFELNHYTANKYLDFVAEDTGFDHLILKRLNNPAKRAHTPEWIEQSSAGERELLIKVLKMSNGSLEAVSEAWAALGQNVDWVKSWITFQEDLKAPFLSIWREDLLTFDIETINILKDLINKSERFKKGFSLYWSPKYILQILQLVKSWRKDKELTAKLANIAAYSPDAFLGLLSQALNPASSHAAQRPPFWKKVILLPIPENPGQEKMVGQLMDLLSWFENDTDKKSETDEKYRDYDRVADDILDLILNGEEDLAMRLLDLTKTGGMACVEKLLDRLKKLKKADGVDPQERQWTEFFLAIANSDYLEFLQEALQPNPRWYNKERLIGLLNFIKESSFLNGALNPDDENKQLLSNTLLELKNEMYVYRTISESDFKKLNETLNDEKTAPLRKYLLLILLHSGSLQRVINLLEKPLYWFEEESNWKGMDPRELSIFLEQLHEINEGLNFVENEYHLKIQKIISDFIMSKSPGSYAKANFLANFLYLLTNFPNKLIEELNTVNDESISNLINSLTDEGDSSFRAFFNKQTSLKSDNDPRTEQIRQAVAIATIFVNSTGTFNKHIILSLQRSLRGLYKEKLLDKYLYNQINLIFNHLINSTDKLNEIFLNAQSIHPDLEKEIRILLLKDDKEKITKRDLCIAILSALFVPNRQQGPTCYLSEVTISQIVLPIGLSNLAESYRIVLGQGCSSFKPSNANTIRSYRHPLHRYLDSGLLSMLKKDQQIIKNATNALNPSNTPLVTQAFESSGATPSQIKDLSSAFNQVFLRKAGFSLELNSQDVPCFYLSNIKTKKVIKTPADYLKFLQALANKSIKIVAKNYKKLGDQDLSSLKEKLLKSLKNRAITPKLEEAHWIYKFPGANFEVISKLCFGNHRMTGKVFANSNTPLQAVEATLRFCYNLPSSIIQKIEKHPFYRIPCSTHGEYKKPGHSDSVILEDAVRALKKYGTAEEAITAFLSEAKEDGKKVLDNDMKILLLEMLVLWVPDDLQQNFKKLIDKDLEQKVTLDTLCKKSIKLLKKLIFDKKILKETIHSWEVSLKNNLIRNDIIIRDTNWTNFLNDFEYLGFFCSFFSKDELVPFIHSGVLNTSFPWKDFLKKYWVFPVEVENYYVSNN